MSCCSHLFVSKNCESERDEKEMNGDVCAELFASAISFLILQVTLGDLISPRRDAPLCLIDCMQKKKKAKVSFYVVVLQ